MSHYDLIVPGGTLYQGDAVSAALHATNFDTLVLCAEELQTAFRTPTVRVIYAGIDDAELSPKEAWIVQNAARAVTRDLRSGKKVLVTCFAGRNRSGLVSALALKGMGYSGDEAIRAVRRARRNALTNESFVQYLRT